MDAHGTRWGRRLGVVALALGCVAGGGPAALADDDDEPGTTSAAAHVARVEAALAAGKVPDALALLEAQGAAERIAADAAAAAMLAAKTLEHSLRSYVSDEEKAPKVAGAALAIARKAASAPQPEGCPTPAGLDDRARAVVFARLAVAATSTLLGEAVPPAEWTEPFAALRKAPPDHPTALADIVLCVCVADAVLDDDAPVEPALRAAADSASFAVRTFPQGDVAADVARRANLALACGLAWTKPSEARTALPAALSAVAAAGTAVESDRALVGLWNRAVGETRRLGVATKHAMLAKKVTAAPFELEIPRESGWTVESGSGDQHVFTIVRSRGSRSQARILVFHYDWDTNYFDDEKRKIGGDNRGGLMRADHAESLALFAKVTRDDKASKGRLSRRYSDVLGYDIRGTSEEGNELRVRGWYFAGEKRRTTYRVMLMQVGSVRDRDGQMDFVLESLHETS